MKAESQSENLRNLLARNKNELDRLALDFLPSDHDSPEIRELYTMIRDYPSRGGKGLRGTLCLLWCELFGGKKLDAMPTAAGLELFQNWILIHDDIEDCSDMRRGLPALHKKYGPELAINAGDALHAKMWELLLRNESAVGPALTLRILSEFSKMINETTEGQSMELIWTTRNNWNIGEEDYLLMVTKKAAWYTCVSPARMGVVLASANRANAAKDQNWLLEELVPMGTDLGISFQIIDDILNLTADESKYGKEILGDIYEGKRTLMMIHLLRNSDSPTREKIVNTISKKREQKTKGDVEFIFQKIKDLGSIEYARNLAMKHSQRALRSFDRIMKENRMPDSTALDTTKHLLEYMTTREY